MNNYVSVADVLDVSEETYQTSAAREWMLIRGERTMRRCDEPAYTITAGKVPAFISSEYEIGTAMKMSEIEEPYRRLTIDECKKLQTFNDDFHITPSRKDEKLTLVGNSVPPLMAETIADVM